MYDEISIFLEQEGVPCISPIETFGSDPDRFFDPTDHLKPDGNEALVRALHAFLAEQGVVHAPS
jgi:hypothetical protein